VIDSLKSIGIEKGKLFAPDTRTQAIMQEAIAEAHAWLVINPSTAIFRPHSMPVANGMSQLRRSCRRHADVFQRARGVSGG